MPLDKDLKRVAELTDKELSTSQQLRVASVPPPVKQKPAWKVRRDRQLSRQGSRITVKKGDSYDSIAEKHGYDAGSLISVPGNPKNIKPGQVLRPPPPDTIRQGVKARHPDRETGYIPPTPQTEVPNLPGYGGTVEDYRAAGATVNPPVARGMEEHRAAEAGATNDNWYMAHADDIIKAREGLSPLARGPKADKIRAQYQRLMLIQQNYRPPASSIPYGGEERRGENAEIVKEWLAQGLNPDPVAGRIQGSEDYAQRQALNEGLTGQGMLDTWSNWFQGLMGESFNPDFQPVENIETLGDVRQQQALDRRQREMEGFSGFQVPGTGGPGSTAAQDQYPEGASYDAYKDPAQEDTGADMPGIYDTDYRGPNGTTNAPDGWVYYNGKAIRQDMFLDYLNSQDRPVDLDSDYWQRQIFVRGAAKNMEALSEAVKRNDRNMMPVALTPAQLELMGTNRSMAEWEDLLRNSWGYLWDPEQGAWIKRVDGPGSGSGGGGSTSGISGRPRSSGRRGGRGGGGGGAGGSRLSAYGRDAGPTRVGLDRRALPGAGSNSQVSWRI